MKRKKRLLCLLRGGSWFDLFSDIRCAGRFNVDPSQGRNIYVGLRVVKK